jgi:hypothetical protein
MVGIGYLTHLVLDEFYSVDLFNRKIKRSFGTALKPFSLAISLEQLRDGRRARRSDLDSSAGVQTVLERISTRRRIAGRAADGALTVCSGSPRR